LLDLSVNRIAEKLPSLEKLILNRYSQEETGSSSYLYQIKSPVLSTLTNLQTLGLSGCKDITSLAFQGVLKSFQCNLTDLSLGGCASLDDSVSLMSISRKVTSLTRLTIGHTNISNTTLKTIVAANGKCLKSLILPATDLHPECLESIFTNCVVLEQLRAGFWRSNASTEEIKDSLKFVKEIQPLVHLKALEFSNWSNFPTEPLVDLVLKCPNLQSLDVANCHLLDDAVLVALGKNCPELKELFLTNMLLVTDRGINELTKNCTKIEVLHIVNMANLTDNSFASLTNLENLKELQGNGLKAVTNMGYVLNFYWHCYINLLQLFLDYKLLFNDVDD